MLQGFSACCLTNKTATYFTQSLSVIHARGSVISAILRKMIDGFFEPIHIYIYMLKLITP